MLKEIILTGPKHCGKTSVGKELEELFSCGFIDLDELITQKTGKTPRQLYSESPALFQQAETEALRSLLKDEQSKRIIAGGGGIIDNKEAVDILKNSGAKLVYLKVSAAAAWQRIEGKELPPFLQTENPQETHYALHQRRAASYLQLADIVIDAENKTPKEVAVEIFNHPDLC